jgi:hypothetical protein
MILYVVPPAFLEYRCQVSTCRETNVDKDLLKRRKNGRAKADAQFFRIRGGMPLGPHLCYHLAPEKHSVPHLQ